MAKKERLDTLLTDRGFFETKSKAQAAIMAGDVKVNGETLKKAGILLNPDLELKIQIKSLPFVSRGGFKLDKAVKEFNLELKDCVCLDAGASTGGFTDCMLQNNAKKVYAVDVGYGQLAWKLRNDARVKVVERTNIKNCTLDEVYDENDERACFCAMDLSFISVTKVLENVKNLMSDKNIQIMTLIKPQFEAGREFVGKNGVVREAKTHIKVIEDVLNFAKTLGLYPQKLSFSPIKGPAGNIEYLVLFVNEPAEFEWADIQKTVETAHAAAF